MSKHILDGVPEKYIDQLSTADLNAIGDGNYDAISTAGLNTIGDGKEDLGVGEYTDAATGITGSVVGGVLGAPFGPPGIYAGSVIGGVVGTVVGEVAEDLYAGRGLNMGFGKGGAGNAASWSGALDLTIPVVGKGFKVAADLLGINKKGFMGLFTSRTPKPPATTQGLRELPAGSVESKLQTQDYLQERGGTLLASQTGRQGVFGRFGEGIANVGTASKGVMVSVFDRNADIFAGGFREMINDIDPLLARTQSGLGEALVGVVKDSEVALKEYYGKALDEIVTRAGPTPINVSQISSAIDKVFADNTSTIMTHLSKGTQKLLRESADHLQYESVILNPTTLNPFRLAKTANVETLIQYQRSLTREIETMRPSVLNPTGNAVAFRELSIMEGQVKEAISATISRNSPEAAQAYKELNKFYGQTLSNLYPDLISNNIIAAAEKGGYESLGRLVVGATDINKVRSLMGTIDTAFIAFEKRGGEYLGDINTPERAKALIRQSFLQDTLTKKITDGVDVAGLTRIADNLGDPRTEELYKAILGEGYGGFKALMNGLKETSEGVPSEFMSLSLRGREMAAGMNTVTSISSVSAAGGFLGGVPGILAANLAVFGVPYVLAKVATNPVAARRLLMLSSGVNRGVLNDPKLVSAQVAKIFEALSDEDRQDIREYGYDAY